MAGRFERVEHSLDIDEALHVHYAERPARVVMGIVILGAVGLSAFGLLGDGKLSRVRAEQPGATLQYPRVMRLGKEEALEFQLADGGEVSIPLEYFRHLKLDKIMPEPSGTRITDRGVTYLFETGAPLALRFHIVPEDASMISATLRVDGEAFFVRHLVLP